MFAFFPTHSRLLCLLALAFCAAGPTSADEPFLDNETLYSNSDPDTETRRSDHFRIAFGHYNRDTGTPVTEELVQGNLQMFEQLWHRWVVELGMNDLNESATQPDGNKYRANFNVLMSWDDGGGGGAYASMDSNGFGYSMANSSYMRFDPPSGATPHEFAHAWQVAAGGFNGTNSSGSWWEAHANWMQLQFLNTYPNAAGYLYNSVFYPAHGRDYYDSWMIFEAAREDPRYGAEWVNEIWTNATPDQKVNEFIIDRMIRLDTSGSPDKAGAVKDLWGDMARKMVTWDYERQRWLAQANTPWNGDMWEWYTRCRTPLVKMPGTEGVYRPARAHIPQQFGFHFVPLEATPGATVSCDFQPLSDYVRQSDWRACLVAVNTTGEAAYSAMWNKGNNSITLSADQNELYLMVIAVPKPSKIAEPAWREYTRDSGLQFPYTVSFTNSGPKNVTYPAQNRSGMHQHANGGGWVSNSAVVDASAYVGPHAQVLNSAQVRNNARIEDYAVVRNSAQVRDSAVVSGHAMVYGNARVSGNAKVRDWAMVFGHTELFGDAKAIEHAGIGGGTAASHNIVSGSAVIKGVSSIYSPSTFSGSLITDGDTANGGTGDRGVHFGWQWGQNPSIFGGLTDNNYQYSGLTFERDNPVFAMDEFGINHGYLLNGSRTAVDSGASRRGGRVLPLDGESHYVELHNSINDFDNSAFAVWFKHGGGEPGQRLWSMGDGEDRVMYLTANDPATGTLRFVISDGTTTRTLDSGQTILPGVWRHAVVVFSGTTCSLYLDGVMVNSSGSMPLFPEDLNAPLMENANYLGRGNAGNFFKGSVDDFRAFNKGMSAAEVAELFDTPAPALVNAPADNTPPSPDAAAWLVEPMSNGDSSVTMSAVPGSDASGWVEYHFTCVSGGGHDSGWVSFNKYTDVGLPPGASPTYTVKMRDRAGNTTASSAPASVQLETSSIGSASFSEGPVGISGGKIAMTAAAVASPSGKVEYKFDRVAPSSASSGWRSSPNWTESGLVSGSTYTYTVTVRDGRGNTSSPSAPASAVARDDAGPELPIPMAHWEMLPYATIDNRISMTAMGASDPSGVQYKFECVGGNGPDSNWQDSPTYRTGVLPVGSYSYRYKLRDKSAANNESEHSTAYVATITTTTGYHDYVLTEVLEAGDDDLVRFPATVMKVGSGHYKVRDLASGAEVEVRPSTYGLQTDPQLALKNVMVKGHLYTFGGERVITYATLAVTGNPELRTVSGRVTDGEGAGIAGATVFFSDEVDASLAPVVTTTTDVNGNYSKGVTDGTWYVAAGAAAFNTSADRTVTIAGASAADIDFTLRDNVVVSGVVRDGRDGAPVAGATVYFSRTPDAAGAAVYTATTGADGSYSQPLQEGIWYMAAGANGYFSTPDKSVQVAHFNFGGIDFGLKWAERNIPRSGDLLFSAITESLPNGGLAGPWPSYEPAGQSWTALGSPSVETLHGVKWLSHRYSGGDGFRQGIYSEPVPINGATIVVAAKPDRNTSGTSWTSIVDLFYNRLVIGIRNNTGRVDVFRNGAHSVSSTSIPDGQTTVLSLVVQPDGKYKVYANGSQIMNVTSTSPMTSLVPNVPGPYANAFNVGRNNPDGWTAFNGRIGDVFVYRVALGDADRQQLEADLTSKFINTGHTLTAIAGEGGVINPVGSVPVISGGGQTFTIRPLSGQTIDDVVVDGVSRGALASYTFEEVSADHTISATFRAGSNTKPVISTVSDMEIPVGGSTGVVPFTVWDAETLAESLVVTATSSNPQLVPAESISLGGSGSDRTIVVTPTPGFTGIASITLTVDDGLATAASSFELAVTAEDGTPFILVAAEHAIEENHVGASIAFSVSDSDTELASLVLSATSSEEWLVPSDGLSFAGSGTERSLSVQPATDRSGTTTIILTVSDGTLSSSAAFVLTVIPLNRPPTISEVPDQWVEIDRSGGPVPFFISDPETDSTQLVLWAASSNPALLPESGISLEGSGTERHVVLTPQADRLGQATVTLHVSDGVTTVEESFVVTVTLPVEREVIGLNVGANGAIADGSVAGAFPAEHWNNLMGSSPTAAAGSLVDDRGIAVGGFAANFTGQQNTFNAGNNPDTNLLSGFLSGSAMSATLTGVPYARYDVYVYYNGFQENYPLTWELTDLADEPVRIGVNHSVRGSSSSGNVFSSAGEHVMSRHATLGEAAAAASAGTGGTYLKFEGLTAPSIRIEETSNAGNNENGFSGIQIVNASSGNQPTVSDVPNQVVVRGSSTPQLEFTVADSLIPADSLLVGAESSDSDLVPPGGIVVGGTGSERTIVVTPAADMTGTALITLSVGNGEATVYESFVVDVVEDGGETAFDAWRQDHFGDEWDNLGLAGPEADPDGDGKSNWAEFAFGGDPRDGSIAGLFSSRVAGGDGPPELMFWCAVRRGADFSVDDGGRQRSAAVDGVIYIIEGDETLVGGWGSSISHRGVSDLPPQGSGLPDLTGSGWEYHSFSAFQGLGSQGFLRASALSE